MYSHPDKNADHTKQCPQPQAGQVERKPLHTMSTEILGHLRHCHTSVTSATWASVRLLSLTLSEKTFHSISRSGWPDSDILLASLGSGKPSLHLGRLDITNFAVSFCSPHRILYHARQEEDPAPFLPALKLEGLPPKLACSGCPRQAHDSTPCNVKLGSSQGSKVTSPARKRCLVREYLQHDFHRSRF